MATLRDIIDRQPVPGAWAEGDNIPWHEPGFSRRMLREHLTQDHDMASRRLCRIQQQVAWIQSELLRERGKRVLDLGCGPGLYAQSLARLGHACVGIDYSPASIAYAREQAANEGVPCSYVEGDLRTTPFGAGFDLAMLLYGEFNVFRQEDISTILAKAQRALKPGGTLLLEVHTLEIIAAMGQEEPSWFTARAGLFGDAPHLALMEHFWDAPARQTTQRYFVIDAATAEVERLAQTFQGYDEAGYRQVLDKTGFVDVRMYPSLTGVPEGDQMQLYAIVAHKP